jgi:exodeoxyribonuclease III
MASKKRKVAEAGLQNIYAKFNDAGIAIPRSSVTRSADSEQNLKFIAWNCASLRTLVSKRSDLLADLWKSERPAVLGLMETKISEKEEAAMEAEIRKILNVKKGDVSLFFNHSSEKKGYSGTLLIVDHRQTGEISELAHSIGHSTEKEGRVISGFFPDLKLHVVLCYSPNSGQKLERLDLRTQGERSFDAKLAQFCLGKNNPVVLIGDLNVAIDDADIYNVDAAHIAKSAGTTPEERTSFRENFLDNGFIDAFKMKHKDATGSFSYWSVRAGNVSRNRGLRLDYTLLCNGQEDAIVDAFILDKYAPQGDHCPVGIALLRD